MAEKRAFLTALAWCALAAACGPQAARTGGHTVATPVYDPETRRLERITYDRNGDGRVDATTFMDGATVVRAELDEDFDGTVDRWEYYVRRPAGAGAIGSVLERAETSSRPDGRVTRRELYDDGVLRSVELDTNGDGRMDKWETWEDGAVRTIELDTLGRGRPDRRIVYAGGDARLEVERDGAWRPLGDSESR